MHTWCAHPQETKYPGGYLSRLWPTHRPAIIWQKASMLIFERIEILIIYTTGFCQILAELCPFLRKEIFSLYNKENLTFLKNRQTGIVLTEL